MDGFYSSGSEDDTARVARDLAVNLPGGRFILLFGDLGTGKTAFVRGLVEGLGGDPADVSSPTFTLIQPYTGRLTVQHVDLYRVEPSAVEDLGLDELATPTTLVAIEWAERLPRRPRGSVYVKISDRGGDNRDIQIETVGR